MMAEMMLKHFGSMLLTEDEFDVNDLTELPSPEVSKSVLLGRCMQLLINAVRLLCLIELAPNRAYSACCAYSRIGR